MPQQRLVHLPASSIPRSRSNMVTKVERADRFLLQVCVGTLVRKRSHAFAGLHRLKGSNPLTLPGASAGSTPRLPAATRQTRNQTLTNSLTYAPAHCPAVLPPTPTCTHVLLASAQATTTHQSARAHLSFPTHQNGTYVYTHIHFGLHNTNLIPLYLMYIGALLACLIAHSRSSHCRSPYPCA